ncbi:1,4-beta-N-acetylmuramidase [Clostridium botulinum]|uniref:1,4-beta-N-acetylmuramidase n=1 Tax=Clostridium botulinum TaxID=1491 RepID=UPI000774E3A5|nr:1,4-beta-N-acetylmuramidase [Clostridium botulinum]MBY6931687.1 1,4-beta-N-acetylmuramidase [Clostridium botulinum]NFG20515.1 1,4-beta-N-acetylmuramidase [Clostridium botulinum]NFO80701.1 1,4-beta-N-acetylmuramidase [Clostridium botulinum]
MKRSKLIKVIASLLIAISALAANPIKANAITKTNQWVQVNGQWQYNDSIGNPIRDNWFYDRDNKNWYYLNSDGIRQTGWMKDKDGKEYYFKADGSLLVNDKINGYKVGADGAKIEENVDNNTSAEWIHDSTGWWYKEGNSYAKGWRYIDENWYYFYSNGYMAHDIKIKDYYLNSSGAWSNDVPESFSKGVSIGMTEDQVLVSNWGRPNEINKTTTKYGTYEQWVYDGYNYLYFENGILTTIQN